MKKYLVVHDKLINFGGAEVVLQALIRYRTPDAILCTCVNNREYWEKLLGVRVLSPRSTWFIKSQVAFKILYPYVALCAYFSSIGSQFNNHFAIVYSSSAGKYIKLPDYSQSILYVNFHAKGIANGLKYFKRGWWTGALNWFSSFFFRLFLDLEDRAAAKFPVVFAISRASLMSLDRVRRINALTAFGVVHCPVTHFDRPEVPAKPSLHLKNLRGNSLEYFIVVSRLQPEKNLDKFLDELYNSHLNIVVVGDGELKGDYEKRYGDRFLFTGFVSDQERDALVSGAEAIVQPTAQEWSLVTVEANIAGVPALSIDCDGVREINELISGRYDFPNLLINSSREISSFLARLQTSRDYLRANRRELKRLFSEEEFHKKLKDIELKLYRPGPQ